MDLFTVREIGLDQIETLMHWRMVTLKEVFDLDPDTDLAALAQRNRAYYEKAIADHSHAAFLVFDAKERPIGCGGLCFHDEMPSPDNPAGTCSYLMNIYIDPAFRHEGAGRALVKHLLDYAKEKQAGKIYLETSDDGRVLYEALGFEDLNEMMIYPQKKEALAYESHAE